MPSKESYEDRKAAFLTVKDGLTKEPSGALDKKEYIIGCPTKEDWETVHAHLIKDGSLEANIPNASVVCNSTKGALSVRGSYMLTDGQATALRNHEKVSYVNLNTAKYPGTYEDNPDDFVMEMPTKQWRHAEPVKHQRDPQTSGDGVIMSNPGVANRNCTTSQLMRHEQYEDPWNGAAYGNNDTDTFEYRAKQFGTGFDVDVIVADQDMWFGHLEFINNHLGTTGVVTFSTPPTWPQNYKGGNVLCNRGISSTIGCCDLLDVVLDAPYYLDPDFFNASPAGRLEQRWDKTTVPQEADARAWWENDSTSFRSPKFVSTGNGGTATGVYDFGTLNIPVTYTRARSNGSNTAYQNNTGYHGTPCASQTYGKDHGWAYNSNKWFINLYGTYGIFWEDYFDMVKVFHQCKPNNPKYGTQDPTITSNSWGFRDTPPSSGWYYFRQGTDGTGGVSFSTKTGTFMGSYWSSAQRVMEYTPGHSILGAGYEMIDSGAIFACAAGNHDQKVVLGDHPDYNNYHSTTSQGDGTTLANATDSSPYGTFNHPTYNTHNRPGFPPQIGIYTGGSGIRYKTISVGAMDDDYTGDGKERKAGYSNMGNAVDYFCTADSSLAGCDDNSFQYDRYNAYYYIDGTISVESANCTFGGTSSATPISVGILATKLEYNRTWTALDLKDWAVSCGSANADHYYYGTEATTATDSNWTDSYNMQGNAGYVIWDKLTGNEPDKKKFISGGAVGITCKGVTFTYS